MSRSWKLFWATGALLVCCASSEHDEAALIARIGASRLTADAALLQDRAIRHPAEVVPDSAWPPAIRELRPRSVRVHSGGVFIQRSQALVEEEGVFIAFDGTVVDSTRGRDPAFSPIAPQIYWYRIKG